MSVPFDPLLGANRPSADGRPPPPTGSRALARARRDLRLLSVAVVTWTATVVATGTPAASAPLALGGWTMALLLLLLVTVRRTRSDVVVVALLAAAAAASAATGVATATPDRAAAVSLAEGGRALSIEATVVGKVDGAGSLRFPAATAIIAAGASRVALAVPVTVMVDRAAVGGGVLDVGSTVSIAGAAFAADAGERSVLVVQARTVEVRAGPAGPLAVAAWLRQSLVAAVDGLPEPGSGLVPGLAVGDTSAVTAGLDQAMKTASLSHLTAVSGANCAIVVALGFGLAAALRLRRGIRIAAGALALVGFVLLVTPEASVVRAAAMSGAAMTATLLGRRRAGVAVLSLGATLCLIADPWLATSLGFALSAAATAALVLLAPPLARGLTRWMPRTVALALSIPLSAQLACGPLLLLVDPSVPVYGVVANLLAGPAAPVATVIGLLACVAAPIPVVQSGLAAVTWLPAEWIAGTATSLASLPAARMPWVAGLGGVVLLAVLGAALVTVVIRPPGRLGIAARRASAGFVTVAVGVAAGLSALGSVAAPLTMPAAWAIVACDVGQGDAFVLRSGTATAVIDTGPDPALLEQCLARTGTGRVDLLVLTHFDLDHRGGLPALLGRVDVFLHGPPGSALDRALLESFAAAGSTIVDASQGMSGPLGDAVWRVLWPRAQSRAFEPGNDSCVVIDIRGGGMPRSLFLGDLSASPQRAIAASGVLDPPYDVVKVAHHGSADQAPELYAATGGRLALVSVGLGNDYGHPRAETLDLVAGLGMTIARTDLDGMVAVALTADGLSVWREKPVADARGPPAPPRAPAVGARGYARRRARRPLRRSWSGATARDPAGVMAGTAARADRARLRSRGGVRRTGDRRRPRLSQGGGSEPRGQRHPRRRLRVRCAPRAHVAIPLR